MMNRTTRRRALAAALSVTITGCSSSPSHVKAAEGNGEPAPTAARTNDAPPAPTPVASAPKFKCSAESVLANAPATPAVIEKSVAADPNVRACCLDMVRDMWGAWGTPTARAGQACCNTYGRTPDGIDRDFMTCYPWGPPAPPAMSWSRSRRENADALAAWATRAAVA